MSSDKKFNEVFHTEFRSTDVAATAQFMNKAFGWKVTDTPSPSFKILDTDGGFEGHVGPVPASDAGPSATNYILVENIEAAEKTVVEAGGSLIGERKSAGGNGFYTWFEAPGGIKMVLWQNA